MQIAIFQTALPPRAVGGAECGRTTGYDIIVVGAYGGAWLHGVPTNPLTGVVDALGFLLRRRSRNSRFLWAWPPRAKRAITR